MTGAPAAEGQAGPERIFAEALKERRSWEELRDFVEKRAPGEGSDRAGWYLELARVSRGAQAEFENWALGRAYAAGRRNADFLADLYASHLALDDRAAALGVAWPLIRALVAEGRSRESLPYLRAWLDGCGDAALAEGLQSGLDLLAPLAEWAEREARDAWAPIRRGLRKGLLKLLTGDSTRQDFNLLFFDFAAVGAGTANPKPATAAALLEALSLPDPGLREYLGAGPDLKALWLDAADAFLIDAKGARRITAAKTAGALAALCAHCRIHEGPVVHAGRELPFGDPGGIDPESILAREGFALANLAVMPPLMVEAFGMRDMLQPDLAECTRRLVAAAETYVRTGRNHDPDYGLLVHFYCRSNGLVTAWMSFLLRLYNPPYPAPAAPGILSLTGPDRLPEIVEALHAEGYYVFKQRLPDDLVDELARMGRTAPCYRQHETGKERTATVYPQGAPEAPKYDFLEKDIVGHPAVQRMMAEPALFAVSQAYLGAKPTLSAVSMWWSTVFSPTASSEAAQKWHFDLDHLQWLKWFIYLEDVDEEAGPHCFIPGTHRIGRKAPGLLQRGYARIEDEEMAACYAPDKIRQITGRKGTLFVEDTSGFHKGRRPESRPRLLLELEFNNTLFGTCFARDAHPGTPAIRELAGVARAYPHAFRKFPFLR